MDKRCGTCVHWSRLPKRDFGGCLFPLPVLPACIEVASLVRQVMWADDGTDCPTWEAKPE